MEEDLYMIPLKAYYKASKGKVCKLIKSIYSLKQASRKWNKEFTIKLIAYVYMQFSIDHYLFTKGLGASFIALIVYVDDVLFIGPLE